MSRVKAGTVMKLGAQPRKRGRPAIDWTRSRKRRLLRLYLCTPESELSLKNILGLLAEGPFQPKPRHTQCLLNDMLSKPYRQKRPRNRAAMAERLAFLRSVRDGSLQTGAQPIPRPEIVKECAILLKPKPGRKGPGTPARGSGGELEGSDSLGSAPDQKTDTSSNPSPASLDMDDSSTDLGDEYAVVEEASPEMFKNPWSTCEDGWDDKIDFLRERRPSASSSFLADVASLLDGLSIRSSLSASSSSGSSCRSRPSVSTRVEPSDAAVQGEWDMEESRSPSNDESTGLGRAAWPADMCMPTALVDMPWTSSCSCARQSTGGAADEGSWQAGHRRHTLENQELVRVCCSNTAWCLHQRINAVLVGQSPAETFACTSAEANSRDGLGNTALHVAARWGAPGPVLFRIMALATHLDVANHLGETFLHVLDPASLAPGELGHVTEYLASRDFNFARRDAAGQSFVDRLMSRPCFSFESLEAILCHLSEPDRLLLLYHQPEPNQPTDTVSDASPGPTPNQ